MEIPSESSVHTELLTRSQRVLVLVCGTILESQLEGDVSLADCFLKEDRMRRHMHAESRRAWREVLVDGC